MVLGMADGQHDHFTLLENDMQTSREAEGQSLGHLTESFAGDLSMEDGEQSCR